MPVQAPLPQQYGEAAVAVHCHGLVVQRESLHVTGWEPAPSPQQKRWLGVPPCLPRQSDGQLRQSSPFPASQMPLPQLAPLPAMQSFAQPWQFSPVSQVPLELHVGHPVQLA